MRKRSGFYFSIRFSFVSKDGLPQLDSYFVPTPLGVCFDSIRQGIFFSFMDFYDIVKENAEEWLWIF